MTRYRPYKAPEYTVPPFSAEERDEMIMKISEIERRIYSMKCQEHKLTRLLQGKHIDIE